MVCYLGQKCTDTLVDFLKAQKPSFRFGFPTEFKSQVYLNSYIVVSSNWVFYAFRSSNYHFILILALNDKSMICSFTFGRFLQRVLFFPFLPLETLWSCWRGGRGWGSISGLEEGLCRFDVGDQLGRLRGQTLQLLTVHCCKMKR